MADAKDQQQKKKEMSDNERALVQYAVVAQYNEKFRKDTPKKMGMKQIKNNNLVELLDTIGKSELMEPINKMQNYKANPLSSYTKEMLEILKPHFSFEGITLDNDTKKAKLVAPFETWHTLEYPNSKKSNFTPANTSIAEYADFLFHKGIESIPNLYKIGVINTSKTKVKDLDSNAIQAFEGLVSKVA
ncbi:MAG: Unknown protein [uncultured Sulfurovum sp.]|uniref:Uncharacterized protein n=1 Tax=uncultured Sulfurovum sp. TaxID=269237 RepID=A0A6S6SJW9_9BACT|nr:MAG: Unknown protein [uncultured Sulfurovum sp.]